MENQYIEIKNARVNNLKGIDLKIPRGKVIVVTGVSGSGKSSLAFDTLYAEGQRRYVESLNSYARQFLGRNSKPEVDSITGIPPAIAIEQKVNTRNPRSTVGTSTEVYDYLKLLYARVGRTYSPVSGVEVKHDTVTDVVDYALGMPDGAVELIMAPMKVDSMAHVLEQLKVQGFSRLEHNGEILKFGMIDVKEAKSTEGYNLIIDRLQVSHSEDMPTRLAESVGTAMHEGGESCIVRTTLPDGRVEEREFSSRFEADGMTFNEPSEMMFTFNSPAGACARCEGFGKVVGIDPDLVIPNKNASVVSDAVACWVGPTMGKWKTAFCRSAPTYGFNIFRAYGELTEEERKLLWDGNEFIDGINDFFRYITTHQYKIQFRTLLARFRGKTICPECGGTRLKGEALYVKVGGKNIAELCQMPISKLKVWADGLELDAHDQKVAQRILTEIRQRLDFLVSVGLDYLTLDRPSATLSGGESQRINIATSLGSSLVGSLYILDEPSIGLHSADTEKLIAVLRKLQRLGNTVVVVEHDEDIIRSADDIIDIGPAAGRLGGEVVFAGTYEELLANTESLTAKYLTGRMRIEVPRSRRSWNYAIEVKGANVNNLKDVSATFPLNTLTVVTGVSGSGKSSLVTQVLYPELRELTNDMPSYSPKAYKHLRGAMGEVMRVEFVDQNPIGKSTRSNPVTYVKAYEEIRRLMSVQSLALDCGFTAAHFSFNAPGGRCEVCQGEGKIKIEMQFMADVVIECDQCHGRRFKDEILEVRYKGKNIYDILEMTVNQAIEFFGQEQNRLCKKIVERLKPLQDVGIGYIKLGQSSSTLSGGENQRVKLASYIGESNQPRTMFIFDEPTTGLHFHDISKLLDAFRALIARGHSLVVIEHNMDVIKCADWVVDLGPEGGEGGGRVVCEGTPEEVARCEASKTGQFLRRYLGEGKA